MLHKLYIACLLPTGKIWLHMNIICNIFVLLSIFAMDPLDDWSIRKLVQTSDTI